MRSSKTKIEDEGGVAQSFGGLGLRRIGQLVLEHAGPAQEKPDGFESKMVAEFDMISMDDSAMTESFDMRLRRSYV